MIDNAAFLSERKTLDTSKAKTIYINCTYCWTRHAAYQLEGQMFISGYCGHDPRRYFVDNDEYHDYVSRYMKEGGKHIDKWDAPQQEALPLFDE